MSGHSKWATTHRQKELIDAKRGAIFTRLANAISIAAKKGGDPEANASLRSAIDKAREANMPKDNIERAIKKGTGELGGEQIEEIYYEAIANAGIQFIVKCTTDNKNRSSSTVKHIFNKNGGAFGSVMWNFSLQAVFMVSQEEISKSGLALDEMELELIDLGILDFNKEEEGVSIYAQATDFQKINDWLAYKGIKAASAELEYVAKEKQAVSPSDQEKLDKVMEELENNEDVDNYYHNIA